jgi:hypothetical protein
MAIKKKTVKVAPKEVETKVETKVEAKVEAPEVKEWTYDELVAMSREDFLKAEADIKA